MKANFILGKKQIILASLVMILGMAVYLNWTFANGNEKLEYTSKLMVETAEETAVDPAEENHPNLLVYGEEALDNNEESIVANEEEKVKTKNLGDSLLVNAKTVTDNNYFALARLSRTKSRDEAMETISTVLNNEKLTQADKKDVSAKAMAITQTIESETRIENLVKAKGFEECIVYINNDGASVVVKTQGLDQEKATQIKNIVCAEGNVKGEKVSITEIK